MSRINLSDALIRGLRIGPEMRFRTELSVQADNFMVDPLSPPMIFLNPAGAIDVLMPLSTELRKGLIFIFVNLSANIVTLKTNADVAFTTPITVAANGATRVVCTGSSSNSLGWVIW